MTIGSGTRVGGQSASKMRRRSAVQERVDTGEKQVELRLEKPELLLDSFGWVLEAVERKGAVRSGRTRRGTGAGKARSSFWQSCFSYESSSRPEWCGLGACVVVSPIGIAI